MNCIRKTKGQGIIEALILILGIVFIIAVALPGVSSKAKILQIKSSRDQKQAAALGQDKELPLCGDIITVPSSRGKAPFRVFLVGTEERGKYRVSGFRWDFTGDGSWDTDITKEPQNYLFELAGEYQLKMLVVDERGNSRVCDSAISVSP